MIEMFHGLAAYTDRGSIDPITLAVKAKAAASGAEVCVADRPIGKIGLVLCGELTALHAQDVWSRKDSKGRRVCLDWGDYEDNWDRPVARGYRPEVRDIRQDHCGECPQDQALVNAWCRDTAPEYRTRGDYAEGWLKADGVSCVWVRTDASDAMYWQARSLAKKLGVPCLEIRKQMRIWDYTGSLPAQDCGDLAA